MPRCLFVAAPACVAAGGPAGGSRGETAAPPRASDEPPGAAAGPDVASRAAPVHKQGPSAADLTLEGAPGPGLGSQQEDALSSRVGGPPDRTRVSGCWIRTHDPRWVATQGGACRAGCRTSRRRWRWRRRGPGRGLGSHRGAVKGKPAPSGQRRAEGDHGQASGGAWRGRATPWGSVSSKSPLQRGREATTVRHTHQDNRSPVDVPRGFFTRRKTIRRSEKEPMKRKQALLFSPS